MGKVPAVPSAGAPLSIPLEVLNVTPDGNVPDSPSVGVGEPVAVTLNEPAVPTKKLAPFGLLINGTLDPCPTVSVKLCVAFVPTPF
jgi:hypothetical protein